MNVRFLQEICRPQTWLEDRVYLLLRHHGMECPDQIDLHALCATYGIEVRKIRGRSRAHAHPSQPNRFVIAVDERLDPASRRVKIAHELGHLLLHEGVQPTSSEWMIDWQESQANHFAEHLLLPFFMVAPLVIDCSRYDAPALLAHRFVVPMALARSRYDRFLARMHAKGFPVFW